MKYAELTEKKGIIRFKGGWAMPQMPEPVDLRKSRQWNRTKVLTGAVMGELEIMSIPDRAAVMTYSLTPMQQREVDHYFDWKDEFSEKNESALSRFRRYFSRVRYDSQTSMLSFQGQILSLKRSPIAKSVMEVIFSAPGAFENKLPYLDFLDEYKEELRRVDVTTAEQLKQVRHNINAKFIGVNVFPSPGTMELIHDEE